MTLPTPLRLKGAPGSPYTRKMLAYLRFRHIPYEFLIGDQSTRLGLPEPRVSLLPTFYLPNDEGEIEPVVDSTPLIRRFETEFEGRAMLPESPVLSFLNDLIEDYGDEWLTKAMFHYRWVYEADIEKAGRILPRWREQQVPDDEMAKLEKYISERQISRLYVVGSNDITLPVIEESYQRFLDIFEAMLLRHPYILGERPASSDLAIYAQLTQLAKFDPTPAAICLERAPRVYAWVDIVDDMSGQSAEAEAWVSAENTRGHLFELLSEIGRTYVPVMLANARAVSAGEKEVATEVMGKVWQQPTFPYQAKCVAWTREAFAALSSEDQTTVMEILEGSGCEALLG